jgi:monothiol glutaredoxin
MTMSNIPEDLKQRIEKTIAQDRIMLFMKGSPAMPQCGFSAAVVQILKQVGVPFGSVNILADAELREGLKQYANWPTYPQLYLDGKLVGGCDIVRDMHARGELKPLLSGESAAS